MSENRWADRRAVDKAVDRRRDYHGDVRKPISVKLTPEELHAALERPAPPPGQAYPNYVTYRGFTVTASRIEVR